MEDKESITIDFLFKGLTRPPMKWGVTFEFLFFNGFITDLCFLASRSLGMLLICIPIHIIGVMVCIKEPRAFEPFYKWLLTAGRVKNRLFWKSSTYDPFEYENNEK
jgi:type IV secretion system protein VirB3